MALRCPARRGVKHEIAGRSTPRTSLLHRESLSPPNPAAHTATLTGKTTFNGNATSHRCFVQGYPDHDAGPVPGRALNVQFAVEQPHTLAHACETEAGTM